MAQKKTIISNLPAVNLSGFGIAGISDPRPGSLAADIGSGISHESSGQYSHIMDNPNLTSSQKKRALLREMGHTGSRQKYGSVEERKAAAKERSELKKAAKREALETIGMGPRTSRTKDERRATSKDRGLAKRNWNRDLVAAVPQTAAYYGLNPGTTRKSSAMEVRELQELLYEELKRKLGYS